MRNIRYSMDSIPLELIPKTCNIYMYCTTTTITINVNGTLRKYQPGCIIYSRGDGRRWVYGNYDTIGLSHVSVLYNDVSDICWCDGEDTVYKLLYAKVVRIRGKHIRIRQRGPNIGHFYYTLNINLEHMRR